MTCNSRMMTEREDHLVAWQSATCSANGMVIHYRRGGGGRRSLIALHGLIGSGACLLPLVRGLEDRFDLILPDARGHGQSSAPAEGYDYSNLADDVLGLIDSLKLDAPILLGHSMGGLTASLVAARRGQAISALILIDPTFLTPEMQREVFESEVAAEHQRFLLETKDDLLAQAQRRSPTRSTEIIEHLVDARLRTSPAAFDVLAPPNPDWRAIVHEIRFPILLLIAERGIVSLETAQELQRSNPLLSVELITDAGHGLPYDVPERLRDIVSSFVSRTGLVR